MIDKSLHSNILTAVISDPSDRSFVSTLRSFFDSIPEPNEDEEHTKTILKNIMIQNIIEKDEVIFNIASADYSDKVISNVLYDVSYTQFYKKSLLAKLNMTKCINKFIPYRDEIVGLLDVMDRESGNKKAENALQELIELTGRMHKTAQDFMLGNTTSNVLVLNPLASREDTSMFLNIANVMIKSTKNRVKTIPVFDNMWGGGAIPGSLYLLPGISGKGKSLVMQNLALYACKHNNPEDFVSDGLTPAVLFFSYEMDFRQCLERTISWLGLSVPQIDEERGETKHEYADRLSKVMNEGFIKFGIKIPIVYITQDTDSGSDLPDAGTIEAEIERMKNDYGLQPIFIAIDYLDRMDLRNKRLRGMGESGADGAVKTRLKAREVRDVAKRKQIAMFSATQLDAVAMGRCDAMEPYQRMFDIILEFGMMNVSGSKNLRAEVEDVVLVHKFEVETKDPNTDEKVKRDFVAVKQEKDRDGKAAYKLSSRDKENFHMYQQYTQLLKNSAKRDMLKLTTKVHAVIPMEGFRMSDIDYAMSIRMFYPSENSDFVSIGNLIDNVLGSMEDDELSMRMDDMFDIDLLPPDEADELIK
ncbi:MAG: DnaB family ATPase [Sarcina sp.]